MRDELKGMIEMKITFITSNTGKLNEVKEKLASLGIEVVGDRIYYPEIQTDTLREVARYGAQWLKSRLESPFMLDDSGLFLSALDGFPGVYSAYAYQTIGNRGILNLMNKKGDKRAEFRTAAALVDASEKIHIFEGVCKGTVIGEERGKNGFGYDPIFMPEGYEITFGEMDTEEKNKISHRSLAFQGVFEHIRDNFPLK